MMVILLTLQFRVGLGFRVQLHLDKAAWMAYPVCQSAIFTQIAVELSCSWMKERLLWCEICCFHMSCSSWMQHVCFVWLLWIIAWCCKTFAFIAALSHCGSLSIHALKSVFGLFHKQFMVVLCTFEVCTCLLHWLGMCSSLTQLWHFCNDQGSLQGQMAAQDVLHTCKVCWIFFHMLIYSLQWDVIWLYCENTHRGCLIRLVTSAVVKVYPS